MRIEGDNYLKPLAQCKALLWRSTDISYYHNGVPTVCRAGCWELVGQHGVEEGGCGSRGFDKASQEGGRRANTGCLLTGSFSENTERSRCVFGTGAGRGAWQGGEREVGVGRQL